MSVAVNKKLSLPCAYARAGSSGRAAAVLAAVSFLSVTVGCSRPSGHTDDKSAFSIEESILYGGSPCRTDEDCSGGICAGAECAGFLVIPSDMARDQAGERLSAAVAGKNHVARRLAAAASRVVADQGAEAFGRARAADLFRFLPCELAGDALLPAVQADSEAVRFYASRSLALCGYEAGVRGLEVFLPHASEPIRLMARAALEAAKAK